MVWREWFNRSPWGESPTLLDAVLDVGLVIFIVGILLCCC